MSKHYRIDGVKEILELGKGGAKVKENSGVVEVRNNADDSFAIVRCADPVSADDVVNKRTLDASTTSGVTKSLRATVAFGDTSPTTIGNINTNGIVNKVLINVETAFDGTAPTLEIGISTDTDKYMTNNEINLKETGVYVVDLYELEETQVSAIATFNADSSTTGSANILLDFATV